MPVPYLGEEFTFYNPDGSTVPVRGWGNQYSAVFETLDGYTVVQDPASGFLEYAVLAPDKEALVPTGTKAGLAPAGALRLPQHARVTRAARRAQAVAAHDAGPRRRWEQRRAERKEVVRAAPGGREAQAGAHDVTGDYTGLVLLVRFPDVSATIPRQDVVDFCNKPGYSGYGNNGSAYDYFRDVSGGRFRYQNLVTEYYTAKRNRAYYTDPSLPYGTRTRELIAEALNDLKAKSFDFSPLSNDNEHMTSAQHYELSLVQADNRFDLERNVNAGDAEDLYGAPTHIAFGDGTAPSSRWWNGTASGLDIESVSAPDDVMTVCTQ